MVYIERGDMPIWVSIAGHPSAKHIVNVSGCIGGRSTRCTTLITIGLGGVAAGTISRSIGYSKDIL